MKDIEAGLHQIHADARDSAVAPSLDQQMEELGLIAFVYTRLIVIKFSICMYFL